MFLLDDNLRLQTETSSIRPVETLGVRRETPSRRLSRSPPASPRIEAEGIGPEARTRLYRLKTSLAAALPAIHEMGIMDSDVAAVVKSLVPNPVGLNYADREHFRFHAAHPGPGTFVGARIKSKVDGTYNITVTHWINRHPDGSFGGVVVASVSMKFFHELFDQIQAKSGGVIALLADDGTWRAAQPFCQTLVRS